MEYTMTTTRACWQTPLAVALLASLCACAKSTEPVAQPAQAAQSSPALDVKAALARAQKRNDPCAFVSQSEMRAIVHAPVVARTINGGNACSYDLPSGPGAHAKVQVDRGDGRIGMQSAGAMSGRLRGVENPLAGVGDQAVQVGPTIMVRSGEDLVSIEMSGVSRPIDKAKAIFAIVKRRL
jgi:hypothetical protein